MFKRFIKDFTSDLLEVLLMINSDDKTNKFVKGLIKLLLFIITPLLFIIDFLLFPIREYRDKRRK